jgi:hypothetical protein
MIEIPTTTVLIMLSVGGILGIFALWSLEKLITDFTNEIRQWRHVSKTFAEACELDGFGHVRDAHYGDLTEAIQMYEELKNA